MVFHSLYEGFRCIFLLNKSEKTVDCEKNHTLSWTKCSFSQIHVIETSHLQVDSRKEFLPLLLAVK